MEINLGGGWSPCSRLRQPALNTDHKIKEYPWENSPRENSPDVRISQDVRLGPSLCRAYPQELRLRPSLRRGYPQDFRAGPSLRPLKSDPKWSRMPVRPSVLFVFADSGVPTAPGVTGPSAAAASRKNFYHSVLLLFGF